ncbi:MAG: lytic transglycosylase domain-containing protein [Candidatus Dadabacteria bacterium]|nr:MAG: lytic transglycosylase domain-containing protein [Candidatus Dadabacteria bacterium]
MVVLVMAAPRFSGLSLSDRIALGIASFRYKLRVMQKGEPATVAETLEPDTKLLELASFNTENFSKYNQAVLKAAYYSRLDPDLIRAVIIIESGFNDKAISRVGASGLMQLMPSTARELGVNDIFNPEENISGGSEYLRLMLDMFKGDLNLALAAYNAGPGAVRKFDGIPPYRETQQYVKKVLSVYNALKQQQARKTT